MIPAIQEINFPSYATLHQATVSFAEMGERTISTQVRIDGDIVPDFTGWELSFKGERFILNTKDPQAVKDNSTRNSLVDLTFVSWLVNELKRYFFFEPTSIDSGTAIADKYIAPVNLPVEDFAVLFNKVLNYYFGGKVVFSLYMSGQGQYSTDRALVEINYTYIWDVLVKFFEIYGVRWRIEYDESDDVYTIKAGWPTTDIDINDHDFEYGYKGGLVRFERQVQDVDIHNILLGRGGEKNIPYRYFKRVDPQNPDWAADPDAIPELANIYFDRLRDINFRWYVRGWMQNPNHDTSWEEDGYTYPSYSISSDSPYYFAYEKGRTDEKFNPVEYVRDLPSIEDYGERWGALDDNDDIFPTIQGVTRDPLGRIDETVAVSEIVTDDISAMAQNSAIEKSINRLSVSLNGETRTEFDLQSEEFTIPSGSTGNITYVPFGTDNTYPGLVRFDTDNSTVVAVSDGIEYPIDAIPAGTYRLKLHMVIARSGQATSATGTFGIENIILTTSTQETDAWKPTFDIWVKNIWGTEKQDGETDVQYAERVWLPILGDRVGNEAKIVFSTGFMSVSEDYEFPIVSYPVHDTSKSINGVPSEWRITLRKSDAEFDATGLYIPNASTGGKPVAGDKFFFIGIDMPHRYVTLAEEDLNTYKSAQLDTEAAISPTWIMNLDKVRVHSLEDEEYGRTLADRLAAGGKVWIKDKRFTPGKRLQLYVQSITYTWNEPTDESPYIVPDIEVVLSDKVVAVDSVVQRIQNDVSSIKNQYARISDVEAVVRSVAEPIFLKKTGESDSSDSPTQFSSKVTSKGFRQGGVGGTGWGIYRDNTSVWAEAEAEAEAETRTRGLLRAVTEEKNTEGDTVFEADRIVVRKELQVNSLVINQISYLGGKEIISAAKIEVSKVIETDNGYVCYFDQRRNSVANNFVVNDIAMGQVFDPYNIEQRYYKALVTAVDIDSITISKTQKVGSGAPRVGDVIVQYGNTTQSGRQYVIVRDVVGGGYERMLSGLSSLNSNGDEYYFAGRESGSTGPRWFVGSHEQNGDYAEYNNGVLTIKANVVFKAGQEIPGLSDLTDDVEALEYLKTALPKSDTIINGGLILSKVIALRDANDAIMSGINGDTSLSNIAAWYGGPMADKQASPTPASYAKSLFRFDGSGYLAGGNIGWEDDGDGHIPGISWETTGGVTSVTIGANVKLEQTGGTDSSVTDLVTAVQSFPSTYLSKADAATLYHPLGGSTTLVSFKIGGATLTWHPQVGSTPGYIELDSAFVTNGDQIVIDGDPQGGGGGGGSTMLRQLEDVYHNATSVLRKNGGSVANGDLLSFDSTGNRWVALDQSTITPDLSNYYTKTQTDTEISTAISALNLGAASTYGVGTVTSGNGGLVTGGSVYSAINEAVSSVLKMQGTTTTAIFDGSTTNPIVIEGSSYTAKKGDVVMYSNKEFWWTGSAWEELGDEASWALKTTSISAGTGLTGGGTLASNRTISLSDSTIASLALADSAYQKPSTGIPQTDLASALSTKIDNGSTAYGYFSNGILPYNHGGTGISSYTKGNLIYASANNTLAKLAPNTGTKQFLTMTSSVPSWDNVEETDVFGSSAIGSSSLPVYYTGSALATITSLDLLSKNTGYIKGNRFYLTSDIYFYTESVGGTTCVRLNAPFITSGDQIVIDGTPGGGGGGGGATTLAGLDDTNITNPQAGQMLSWNGTKWVNTNAPTGSITSVSLAAGESNGTLHLVVNGTAQSDVAVTGLKALAYKDSLAFSEITGTASASQIPTLAISKISGLQTALDGKQPLDADLTAIAGLTGTSGFLKKTAANTWSLDTNTYLTGITSTMVTNALGYTPANATVLDDYVKLNPGAVEQTIQSSISSINKGVINLWRKGNNWSFIGFSNGDTETFLGSLGFLSSSDNSAYRRTDDSHYYKIWDAGNDGASSGLDADLLDGQHGSYYAPLSALDNYLPLTAGTSKPLTDSLYIITGDTDKCIQFSYDTRHISGAAWRILSSGSGSGDTNYLSFQTGGSTATATTWSNVLRLSMDNHYVGINMDAPAYQLDVAGVTQIAGNPSSGILLRLKNTSTNNAWMGFYNSTGAKAFLGAGTNDALILQNASGTSVFSVAQGGAASFSSTLSVAGLSTLTGGATIPSAASLKIGNATITWNSNGYLHIDQPLVTAGDQIVISGTPGGGGGGGATTLAGLDDVAITSVANGQLLQYNGSKWVNVAASTVGRIYSPGTGISISASNVISLNSYEYYSATTSRTANTVLAAPNGSNGAASFRALMEADIPDLSGTYLPLNVGAGKTITSTSNTPLNINSTTTSNEVGFRYQLDGENKAFFGYNANSSFGAYMYNYNGPHRLGITDAGMAHFDGYALLHAGNYTSYVNTTNFPGLNGNQTITLSGDVSGSGTTSISVSIGQGKVTNAMLAGSIENSKLNTIGVEKGGTGLTTWTGAYRLIYSSAATTVTTLAPNSTTTRKFLRQVGANNAATAPAWDTVTKTDVGLSNVENTALSTWAGTNKITTLGTITTGTWNGTSIANSYLANSAITINGSSTSLGGSFSTASITAGTAGQSTASSGVSFSVPYVTMNAYGIVTGYGTHTHTISASELTTAIGSTTYAPYNADGYLPLNVGAGKTITSTAFAPITINTTASGNYINFEVGGDLKAQIGYSQSAGAFLQCGSNYVNLDSAGVFKRNNSDVFYHSGNSNLSTVPWACSTLTASGNISTSGYVSVGTGGANSYVGSDAATNIFLHNSSGYILVVDGVNVRRGSSASTATLGSTTYPWAGITATSADFRLTNFTDFHIYRNNSGGSAGITYYSAAQTTNYWNVGMDPTGTTYGGRFYWYYTGSYLAYLTTTGIFVTTGDQVISSDLTLKENLTPVTYSVSDIAKARAVEFDWKDGRGHSMGSIAQDWLSIAPALVHGEEGNMSLAYGQLALVNTIIEAREIETLKARVAELEAEVKRLRMN